MDNKINTEEFIYTQDLKDFITDLEFKRDLEEIKEEEELKRKIKNDMMSEGQRIDYFIAETSHGQSRVIYDIIISKLKEKFIDKSDKMYVSNNDGKHLRICCCCPKQTCLNPNKFVKETSCHND